MGKERLALRKDPYAITVVVVASVRQGGVSARRLPARAAVQEPIAA